MVTCLQCGQENPEGFKFCGACGAPLVAEQPREVRKTVTVVFCDVTGSTALGEQLDPESLRRVMSRYFDEAQQVLERHGGTVEKFIGDAVMAVFGVPVLHEDDALRAVRASVELRDSIARLSDDLERDYGVGLAIRTGVNTGEVVAGDTATGQKLVTGDAVNTAARLEQAAQPGEVLIGRETHRLVRDSVEVEEIEPLALKGKGEPVPALRLLQVVPDTPGHARHLDSPMVGREREQLLLHQAFQRVVEDRSCQLFTVLGTAGVGKSRLMHEFTASVQDEATVLSGRCLSYGEGITFWPLMEVVRNLAGEDVVSAIAARLGGTEEARLVAERISGAIGLTLTSAGGEETFWAVRKLFEAHARERPLVVAFDDVHWAEPTFLDLVEHVAEWCRDSPILLVCLGRPELLDLRPSWGGGKLNATAILLEPLAAEECSALIDNLLGRAGLADEVRGRIAEAAEGNPLFVEEMLEMLIDDGLLLQEDGHWRAVAGLSQVSVPPTIQALLSARLDRLNPGEREVIRLAAVEGKVFHRTGLAELMPEEQRSHVPALVMSLVRKELIRPEASETAGDDVFRFRHQLTRDAAYDSLPKEERAVAHERLAAWLEDDTTGAGGEYDEILGYHLEQAYRYRTELAPEDDAARAVALRAARRLASSGKRAYVRGDASASVNLLHRAASLFTAEDSERRELLPALAEALMDMGELERARATITAAIETAEATGDLGLETRMALIDATYAIQTDPGRVMQSIVEVVERAIPVLEELHDVHGLAEAHLLSAKLDVWSGRIAAAEEKCARALEYARLAGDRRAELQAISWQALAIAYGNVDAATGVARIDELVAAADYDRALPPSLWTARGILLAMLGRFDDAIADVALGRSLYRELGVTLDWASTAGNESIIYMLAGDPEAAEVALRGGIEALRGIGETGFASTLIGHLGAALYALERYDEAYAATTMCEEAAAKDDIDPQIHWRRVRAKLFAREGKRAEAEALAREALELVSGTDLIDVHAIALMDQAEVYRLTGREEERNAALSDALGLCEQRGNVVGAERARAALAET